ncbi:MAG: hypothetical protein N2691_04245 [Patescibacteria group bacterium]|nr:hypothetical protein [Patescibacteria group bacterium]
MTTIPPEEANALQGAADIEPTNIPNEQATPEQTELSYPFGIDLLPEFYPNGPRGYLYSRGA